MVDRSTGVRPTAGISRRTSSWGRFSPKSDPDFRLMDSSISVPPKSFARALTCALTQIGTVRRERLLLFCSDLHRVSYRASSETPLKLPNCDIITDYFLVVSNDFL